MIVRLMGTGAAEGIPAFYSDSRVSRYARKHGGRDVRTRAGALLDGQIKIDLPPDTLMQLQRDGLDAMDWSALVFTHGHDDHFALRELQYCLWPFNDFEYAGFTIYGNEFVTQELADCYPDWPFEVVTTVSFQPIRHAGYTMTPLQANHLEDEDCHNLLFETCGKSFLYATDTGVWKEPTWAFLDGRKLDLLVLECTKGLTGDPYEGHLGVADFKAVVKRLREMGTLSSASLVVSTHHSHNGDATHAELEAAFKDDGVIVGYDGLEISV
jgi:phosphoribosyl 1,2-cyclic phosphate phosphodiesterase